jgi:hypothetical protein
VTQLPDTTNVPNLLIISTVMMEAIRSSETSVPTKATRCHPKRRHSSARKADNHTRDSLTFLYVGNICTSQETQVWASTACYRVVLHTFTFTWVDISSREVLNTKITIFVLIMQFVWGIMTWISENGISV